ncbi:MAG: peptide chain release factor 2 [Erysipelotrichales bacterium]|nr:peptide chain release factor 2 [Erysipelotrichales bacterium]
MLTKSPSNLISLVTLFDIDKLKLEITDIENKMSDDNFWSNQKESKVIMEKLSNLKEKTTLFDEISSSLTSILELVEMASEEENDLILELDHELENVENKIHDLNIMVLFSGEFDGNNAILEFHPGAGGTESQDWAEMLYRMYVRWAEEKRFKMQVLDYQVGEEAGIKSASIMIKGKNAYGLLKGESGVHRLVRISPFDASGRRHTSFASVEVMPEVSENTEIEILDKDLKIDTYRSQGAGGQNVNKTESAVRITHIPTGIVVSCQVDRSQLQNKELAMNMLRSRLYQLKMQEKQNELDKLRGEQKNIEWGSQIRSYVFCPYTMVKDLRTNYQEGDVNKVMDGQIDNFIDAYLEMEAKKNA